MQVSQEHLCQEGEFVFSTTKVKIRPMCEVLWGDCVYCLYVVDMKRQIHDTDNMINDGEADGWGRQNYLICMYFHLTPLLSNIFFNCKAPRGKLISVTTGLILIFPGLHFPCWRKMPVKALPVNKISKVEFTSSCTIRNIEIKEHYLESNCGIIHGHIRYDNILCSPDFIFQ